MYTLANYAGVALYPAESVPGEWPKEEYLGMMSFVPHAITQQERN